MRLDIDWLTDSLAIGGCVPKKAADRLVREHRITRIVDCRAEDCDEELWFRRHGIQLLHLPTDDKCALSPEMLRRGVAWVQQALSTDARVLIHCQHGIGRSALLSLCVLVARGFAPVDAMTLVKDARPVASPSPEQLGAFIAFCEGARRAQATRWSVPDFDALARIAYRHLANATG